MSDICFIAAGVRYVLSSGSLSGVMCSRTRPSASSVDFLFGTGLNSKISMQSAGQSGIDAHMFNGALLDDSFPQPDDETIRYSECAVGGAYQK